MTFVRVRTQCVKELTQFARDRLSLALAFVLPAAMLLIFGFAVRLENHDIPIAAVDLDRSSASRALLDRLTAADTFTLEQLDARDAERALQNGAVHAVLTVPPGFQRGISAQRSTPLQLLVDGADVVNARVVRNDVLASLQSFTEPDPNNMRPHLIFNTRIWFNPGRSEGLFIVPGVYAIVLGLFPTLLAAVAMVRDREEQTMLQVYASSVSAIEYLSGKVCAYTLIAVGEACVVMTLGALIWGLHPIGDPTPLLVGTPLFALAVVSLGSAIGARSATQSAAVQAVGTISNLPTILFTGFLYPLSNVPSWLRPISTIVPARYFIDITRDAFVRGGGWEALWYAPFALAAIAAVTFTFAWRSLHRMRLTA